MLKNEVKENENLNIVSIRELLKENLTIPEYQRPYRWSTDTAITFVNDTYSAFINKQFEYRIGQVVLHKGLVQGGNHIMNVVDGQQRLTTISIMLFIFKELLEEDKFEGLMGLLDAEYNELSSEAIVNNLDAIKRKLQELDKTILLDFSNYLLDKCTIVKIITDSEQEAFQFFDSQNARGKALSPHDLLKSYHLREMRNETLKTKVDIINLWENTNQAELANFFSDNLFPLVRWYKSKDAIFYSVKDIKTFKGIQNKNNYNFSVYNRAANLYIEKFNQDRIYELTNGSPVNKFQLTQPILAGRRFFEYALHYNDLCKDIEKLIDVKYGTKNDGLIVRSGSGDEYIYDLFVNVLVFFVDKFNVNALTDARMNFLYKWAYSLRLRMHSVYVSSVNKYALGKSERLNEGVNMFYLIAEMHDPMELDTIVIDKIQSSDVNVNSKRYKEMIRYITGEVNNNNE